jgi:feruloyl esterase
MTRRSIAAVSSLFILACVLCPRPASAASCESLRNLMLPNTTIETATSVATGPFEVPGGGGGRGGAPPPPPPTLPAHCRVVAVLAPSSDSHIVVEIWMPADNWNGKFEAVGNGGWAGNITYGNGRPEAIPRTMASGLNAGYATASTDTGHVNDGTQGRFALGHPEKLIDFAYRAVHEMTVTSKAVIAAFYGSGPKLSYWNGCSSGGRQALIEAQRFPNDFDGIAAGAAANYWSHLGVGIIAAAQATHAGQPGNMPKEKLQVLHDAVLAACDANDGVKDGIITDPMKCTFDVKRLACKGADSASCLTDAQVVAAEAMYAGARNPRTKQQIFTGVAYGSEMGWDTANGLVPFPIADSAFKDVIFKDASWDYRTLNLDKDVAAADSSIGWMDAIDPNLKPFFAHGGKLLQYHGWNDQQVSPFGSITYYKSVEATLGHNAIDTSYRLFMEPGMMHCGGGDGPNSFDPMAVLEKWREGKVAPDQIVATHSTNGAVDMSRPLCPYPEVAVYNGVGSTNDAASFACKVPPKPATTTR